MKTVLLTGFEPFAGNDRNPSAEVVGLLDGRTIRGHRVVGRVLACEFRRSSRQLVEAMREFRPSVVIGLGLAEDRSEITPERVAINVDDARIADNAGRQPIDRPVVRGAAVAYWSTLPVKAIVAALRSAKLPANVSQTAGTFVCNHVFYALMHELRRRRLARGGFIHLPWPSDWPGHDVTGPRFVQITDAVVVAIDVTLSRRTGLRSRGGAVA